MGGLEQWNWFLDGWIILAGVLCAASTALLGNFLVLRKMSMLGDAITHAILPGLAAAFMISDSRSSLPMFVGAVIAGILTALFTEWIRGFGKVDEGASMGVVFTSLFALGLVMIVQAADHVDLDPGCVLYGAIELTPLDTILIAGWEIPRVVAVLSIVLLINLLFVICFLKELKLSSFDPALATTTGFNATIIHYTLMTLVAITAVASFETVGNILVVAMFVVPPAAAYMLTDRLGRMIVLSVILAIIAAVTGHISAITVPRWFGYHSTSTAGMMAVASGLLFVAAALFAPRHGVIVIFFRRQILAWKILAEDIIALMYRIEERDPQQKPDANYLREILFSRSVPTKLTLHYLTKQGHIADTNGNYELTETGRDHARQLVRSHRLWEHYLVEHAGMSAENIHKQAERLEHFTDRQLREKLNEDTLDTDQDPHGSPIPPEDEIR
ncbi:metal ABC transporter permease [uncultured Gimesia sp.]|jgi:manganese/zinc/iron transport system permease protein|uniref:metal ABC transporter permease n=1 Tax=uncultured Gimesia sp. TaxID=1678688 RepID=UPI002628EE9D|nr:metal ABC transporter permease [uncultured Gimesia sp.]